MLVESDEMVEMTALERGLAILPVGAATPVWLSRFCIARPCEPFSRYASRRAESDGVKAALQFLDHGMRGYYCAFESEGEAAIAVGDQVLIPSRSM